MVELSIENLDINLELSNLPLHAKPCLFFYGDLFEYDA
jgi:hypothetical protein